MNDNKERLYKALSQDYDMGTFEQFKADIADEGKRKKLYDAIINEYDLGDYKSFTEQLMGVSTPSSDKSQYTFTEGQIGAMVAIIFGCLVLLFFVIKRHKDKMKINFYISALLKSVIIGVIVFLISFFALEALSLARRYVEAKEYDARYEYSGGIVIDKKEHKYYVIEENK